MSGTIVDVIVAVLLLAGTIITLAAGIGLIRFPDVYNRMHATGKAGTLGISLLLLAGTIYFSFAHGLTLKLLLIIPFLFWTSPAGVFMTARAAHRTGPQMAPESVRDDLKDRAGIKQQKV